MSAQMLQEFQGSELAGFILESREYAGELTLEVDAKHIHQVCLILRDKLGYDYLSDISAIDYFTEEKRFGVAYNIINLAKKNRLRVTARVEEDSPELDSVHDVWQAATWFEREAFDMMGIRFTNHPDLRRLFMPEDFEYFPLRKEFPLLGIPGSIEMPEPAPPKEYK